MGCEFCRESDDKNEKDERGFRRVPAQTAPQGVLIAISGPPRSGRSELGSLLVNNLSNCFLLRQEDYIRRGSEGKDDGDPSVLCDGTKVDDKELRKDVLVAAKHYKYVIVEGTWAFQDPALVKLLHHKIHLNMSQEECFMRLVCKAGHAENSEGNITEELFDTWFKPYFQDAKGYIHQKVLPLTEKSSESDVMIFYVDDEEVDLIQEAAETVLATVLGLDKAELGEVSRTNDSATSSCAAAAASDEKWTSSGHGRSTRASSSSEEIAAN